MPRQTNNVAQLIPPPILTAQAGVTVGSSFTITVTPDDPAWRLAITAITVNGSTLAASAFGATQAGQITFDASKSALLQTAGRKQIVISATGYSDDSVVQNIALLQPVLGSVAINGGRMSFSFTSATGQNFSVLGTNDVTAPLNTWPVIGTATEMPPGSGQYEFADPNGATNGSRFYILRQP